MKNQKVSSDDSQSDNSLHTSSAPIAESSQLSKNITQSKQITICNKSDDTRKGRHLSSSHDSLLNVTLRKKSNNTNNERPYSASAISSPSASSSIKCLNSQIGHSPSPVKSLQKKFTKNTNNSINSKPLIMRRAMSKDSIDSIGMTRKDREKENRRIMTNRGTNDHSTVIVEMEKEKLELQTQISELVRGAESKRAEIEMLRMEIKRLKENRSESYRGDGDGDNGDYGDDESNRVIKELEILRAENDELRIKLSQFEEIAAEHAEFASVPDSTKEQLLLLRNSSSGSLIDNGGTKLYITTQSVSPSSIGRDKIEMSSDGLQSLTPMATTSYVSLPGPSGLSLPRPLSEWDKQSSSSMSELSVACLQDRIIQMEETHYSTNEELQATLQELTDLQDQLTELHLMNEQLESDKSVLLESLCSQTEKLEECRSKMVKLRQLLIDQYSGTSEDGKPIGMAAAMEPTERESHLVELLKVSHHEQEELMMKKEELTMILNQLKGKLSESQHDMVSSAERTRFIESLMDIGIQEKRSLESELISLRDQLQSNQTELSRTRLQLDAEAKKVNELHRERDAIGRKSDHSQLLNETNAEKESLQMKYMLLVQQLSDIENEMKTMRSEMTKIEDNHRDEINKIKNKTIDLERQIVTVENEKREITKKCEEFEVAKCDAEMRAQKHFEDKKDLKNVIEEYQRQLNEVQIKLSEKESEANESRQRLSTEQEEWRKFQDDLLVAVRVANDFKSETQMNCEKLLVMNKSLRERIGTLEFELKKVKLAEKKTLEHSVSLPPELPLSNPPSPLRVSEALLDRDLQMCRRSIARWGEYRGASQLSVRALIESIESATKQKQNISSRSSSSSSINSTQSLSSPPLAITSSDMISKRENQSPIVSIASKSANPKSDGSTTKEVTDSPSPVSPQNKPTGILTNKGIVVEPLRRTSYCEMTEKKDPLAALVKGGGSKRNALLKWCQNKTMGYKGIDITNFSSSWNDGLAFCALLHTYLPQIIPYHEMDGRDKRRNFTIAFHAAESVGIQSTLNINELITQERPDWHLIMAYVTNIYKHFEA